MLRHKIHEITLENGLKGLIIDTPKTGVVVCEVSFRAGEFLLKKEKWETAHLMEHVLLGANKYFKKARDFQAAIEQNGAYSNASTSVYDITYEIESAHFEWQRVVGLLLDAISTPKFLQEEVDSELSNVREELISRSNNHFRALNAAMRQSMGMISLTDQERVELLHHVTRQDLVKHYSETHTIENARFIIAGNFKGDYTSIETMFRERLVLKQGNGRIAMPDEVPLKLDDPLVLRKPSVPNIYLYFDMYLHRQLNARERIAMQVVSTYLTETMYSRIFGTAREKGWVYGMGSGAVYAKDLTGWWLGAQVSKTNSAPLLRLVRDELVLLHEGVVDDEEFESARKHLLGKTMRAGQTASGLVSRYGSYYADDIIENVNLLPKMTKKIDKKLCIDIMRELIDQNCYGIGMLGSISLQPARQLKSYIESVFPEESDV
ncbi:MAG TPA: insulinase family protein [Candidatus Saccharibacteria bacterium]|nr:insulinase family protein [Candidatus Saccharibacteria bacterium]